MRDGLVNCDPSYLSFGADMMDGAESKLIDFAKKDLKKAQQNVKEQVFKSNKNTVDKFVKGKGKGMAGMKRVGGLPLLSAH